MLIKRLIIFTIALTSFQLASEQLAKEKDLAFIFPIDRSNLILTTDFSSSTAPFPKRWYETALDSFSSTLIGDAVYNENFFSDWAIVSIRIVPCGTFQLHISESNDLLCWPEIRLVWQPVLYNFQLSGQRFAHYADDRAFHTLYHIPAEQFLPADSAEYANHLLSKAKSEDLSSQELEDFVAYSRHVSNAFLNDVLTLRASELPNQSFEGIGYRPETLDSSLVSSFYQRLKQFLIRFARPSNLKALTAFSLPEGRQPALIGEWVFLSFEGNNGEIEPTDILINSSSNGGVLANLGHSQRATASRDDDRLYEEPTFSNVMDSTILFASDFDRLGPVVADRSQLLVPNTSCASCHKLNNNRFDFHNLSYLQDRTEMTISPRVLQDVALDMQWINQFLNSEQPEIPDPVEPDPELPGPVDPEEPEEPPVSTVTLINDSPVSIPDNKSTGVSSIIQANDLQGYSQVTLNLNIEHTYRSDLRVVLLMPSGNSITLHNRSGGSQDDLTLSRVISLEPNSINGQWTLIVSDHARRDIGSLVNWSLTFE
ncbi:MAG: proprotein convertase P-domain-containing protein [Gammaproteobacteria bacterium]|nr:proprotein convertase P-domain-containing protein [Gammaproteobacteria bacterium]